MATFVVPANLAAATENDPSPTRRRWLGTLSTLVTELGHRWSLTLGAAFQPGGRSSWVAPATDPDGRDLVFKVAWRHSEAAHEAAGLQVWNGVGAIIVYDTWWDGWTSALLLERCRPGSPLSRAVPEEEQDIVISELLRRLWRPPAAGCPFRPFVLLGPTSSRADSSTFRSSSTQAWPGPAYSCFGSSREKVATTCCCALVCTQRTSSRRSGNPF